MFEETKSQVFWFVVALVAVGLFTTIAVLVLTDYQDFLLSFLKRTENY